MHFQMAFLLVCPSNDSCSVLAHDSVGCALGSHVVLRTPLFVHPHDSLNDTLRPCGSQTCQSFLHCIQFAPSTTSLPDCFHLLVLWLPIPTTPLPRVIVRMLLSYPSLYCPLFCLLLSNCCCATPCDC